MPLCYYTTWRRQSAAEKAQICAFPCAVRSLSSIPSQFCLCAGGTSWWTIVTQPPQGILMMNSAMTFSSGNLSFFFSFFFTSRWWLDKPQKEVITYSGCPKSLAPWMLPCQRVLKHTCTIYHFVCVCTCVLSSFDTAATKTRRRQFSRMGRVRWDVFRLRFSVLLNTDTKRCQLCFCTASRSFAGQMTVSCSCQ